MSHFSRRAAAILAAAGLIATALGPAAAQAAGGRPKEGSVQGHRRILIVTYHVVKDCHVRANYPSTRGPHWTVHPGATISWRYNVNRHVAAVSDPAQISRKAFPHWGFVTNRSCIGTSVGQTARYRVYRHGHWGPWHRISYPANRPVPKRILSGRSQYKPYWRRVAWHPSHPAHPSAHSRKTPNRTLRDAPHRFVIGDVFAGWHVHPTGRHKDGYTEVYVPALHRWGWLQP